MAWFNFLGNIADMASLGLDLRNMTAISRLIGFFGGRKGGAGATPSDKKDGEPIKAEASGKGFADEVLFLLAFVTKWADAHGILLERKLNSQDYDVFIDILRRLNATGHVKAANLLTHVIGFKGATKTIKVPKGTRTVGKAPNQKNETIYAEYQEDINPSGAHILIFFGEIGPEKAFELLTESHILDNLEDKAMAAAKKAGIEASAIQKAGDTKLHEAMAFYKLGCSPTLLRQVLDSPALKKKRAAIDAEVDPVRKAALHEEYQAFLVKKTKALIEIERAKAPQAGLSIKTISVKGRDIPLPVIRTGWSTSSTVIRIGVPAFIVVFLFFLATR